MSGVYRKIAAILSGFAGEHGLPNAIGVTELAQLMNAASESGCKLMLGKIFRNERIGLNRELLRHGLVVTAYGPSKDGSHMVAWLEATHSRSGVTPDETGA